MPLLISCYVATRGDERTHTKVRNLHATIGTQQNISRFDISRKTPRSARHRIHTRSLLPMDVTIGVEVIQSFDHLAQDSCDSHLIEHTVTTIASLHGIPNDIEQRA